MFSTFPAPENALAGAFFLPQFPAKKSHEESLSIFYLSAKRLDFRQTADYNMAKISPAGRSSSGHILEDNYGLFNG